MPPLSSKPISCGWLLSCIEIIPVIGGCHSIVGAAVPAVHKLLEAIQLGQCLLNTASCNHVFRGAIVPSRKSNYQSLLGCLFRQVRWPNRQNNVDNSSAFLTPNQCGLVPVVEFRSGFEVAFLYTK